MSIGMFLVRRFFREFEGYNGDNVAGSIRQVVQAVCPDGNRLHDETHDVFAGKEKKVQDDTHDPAHISHTLADFGFLCVLPVGHKFSDQPSNHRITPFSCLPIIRLIVKESVF